MKSDANRIESYNAGVTPATVSLIVAARLPTMKTSFASATDSLVADQLHTAQILDAAGIVGLMRGRYHAFSNRLHHIVAHFSGAAATNMAQLEHDRWESSNQSAIMINIALDVYGLVVA